MNLNVILYWNWNLFIGLFTKCNILLASTAGDLAHQLAKNQPTPSASTQGVHRCLWASPTNSNTEVNTLRVAVKNLG